MSYVNVDDSNIIEDINDRKEFRMLARDHTPTTNIIPHSILQKALDDGRMLRLRSYQLFVRNFMNPSTPYSRLLIMHGMGTGKTASGLSIGIEFIRYFKQFEHRSANQPFVYIIGFTRSQFERDLFRFPEFGFITRTEQEYLKKLRKYATSGSDPDVAAYKEFQMQLKRRLGNQKGNGFFRFIGYRELTNRIFVGNKDITNMNETEIKKNIADGFITLNAEFIANFKNCLIICDEIHNVYNTLAKNNWGVSIQILLDEHGDNIRAVFMSGTVMKNSQTEIVDVLNLIAGSKEKKYSHSEFFDANNNLKQGALEKISEISRGRVSFLVDINPSLYPSHSYEGVPLEQSKYISFVRTKMTPLQMATYKSIEGNSAILHEHSYIFDMVFPNPSKNSTIGIFKSSQLKMYESADTKWLSTAGIIIDKKNMTINGNILSMPKLAEFSNKYPKMLEILEEHRSTGHGKTFIYHKFVHMTGVYLIGNILSANGYAPLNTPVGALTNCALCKHTFSTHPKNGDHEFMAARYIIVHGEMNKKIISNMIDNFNAADNKDGSKIMVIIGSRVMRESYDLDSVRNEIIISRPDNIPSLLQITARAIRSGSHKNLPADQRHVKIYIITTSLDDGTQSYEEEKYVQKVVDYTVIQCISRALNKTAVDAVINRGLIEPALVNNDIGNLYFDPDIKVVDYKRPEDMNLSTFNIYHKESEVLDIIYIIKRLFMGYSKVWNADDLWAAVKAPPFYFEYDSTLFDYDNFIIALERIIWNDDYLINDDNYNLLNILDVLQDDSDKRIILAGRVIGTIVQIQNYYIAVPINTITNMPDIYVDSPFRTSQTDAGILVDVTSYTRSILSKQRFEDLKISFIKTYSGKPITQMFDAICMHGVDFHMMLIEEVISYVFNLWTDSKMIASKEYNAFYFQMLYYYDTIGLIIWLNSSYDFIRDIYDEFNIKQNDNINDIIPKKYDNTHRGRIIHIARAIERSGCSWCPDTTQLQFNNSIKKSQDRFVKISSGDINATDDIVPIGHYIDEIPKFYHPGRNWFSVPEYVQNIIAWKENDIIIGYDTRSQGGLHIRFKMRNPKQKIKSHTDARLAERGVICTSKSKPFLLNLCKKIGVKNVSQKNNITSICNEVRARLMYLELIERSKNSNIKWYYSQFEEASHFT